MKWTLDIISLAQQLIPFFLKNTSEALSWVTSGGLNWVTASGQSWGTSSDGRHKDWIAVLVTPIKWLNDQVVIFATSAYYQLSFNGQVIYLEHYLNDLFDNNDRRIFISDDSLLLAPYLFNKEDNEDPLYIYNKEDAEAPFYIYNREDYYSQGSFIINVPSAIPLTASLINQIKSATNRYKQAGVNYTIVNF